MRPLLALVLTTLTALTAASSAHAAAPVVGSVWSRDAPEQCDIVLSFDRPAAGPILFVILTPVRLDAPVSSLASLIPIVKTVSVPQGPSALPLRRLHGRPAARYAPTGNSTVWMTPSRGLQLGTPRVKLVPAPFAWPSTC